MHTNTAVDLEKLRAWLNTYPGFEGGLQADFSHNANLLIDGMEETSRCADILGNYQIGCRYRFGIFWQEIGVNDDADAKKLLDFQHWVQEQSILGLAPKFGDVPESERIRTEKGGMTARTQIVTYTVTLVVDFVKAYEMNNGGIA